MIELNSLKKQNQKFKITLFFSYILFAALILGAIYLLHVTYAKKQAISAFKSDVSQEASYKQEFYKSFYKDNANLVRALAHNSILHDFIAQKGQNFSRVHSLFKTLMESQINYMQLRYIDQHGKEIIRLDRESIGSTPLFIKEKNLQDKSNRYYYKACCRIDKDEVWFSLIDLNIEHNKIEHPIKPVLRVAHQVHVKGKFKGFVIVNIFMQPYLKNLIESSTFDIYLVDKSGYFLLHQASQKNWSRHFNPKLTTQSDLQIDLKLLQNSRPFFDAKKYFFIQPLSYKSVNEYRLIYLENAQKKAAKRELIHQRIIITILFALFIAIPFAYIASSPAKRLYQSLYAKSNDITHLANNLEVRVAEEIEKNRKKDKIVEDQSKLAALGEMIGNIAHQWRHPLTRISLILQNIKNFKNMDSLSDEQLDRYITNALEQTDYMSQTIDDFKNFYKPDTKKTTFKAKHSIDNAYKIINASIKYQGIKFIFDTENDFFIRGLQNQFSHVLLNIIHNAKDAIESREVLNPYIKISLGNTATHNQVIIEDNAGGVTLTPIDKVFDAYVSTKGQSGTGIGLYMSKTIIEDNFKGQIYVKNSSYGASFIIELPHAQTKE